MPHDPVASLRGKMGAHTSWANTSNPTARTAPARAASFARFVAEIDPDHKLPDSERERRAEHLHRAHMSALALKSVASRRKAVEARRRAAELISDADDADAELSGGDAQ